LQKCLQSKKSKFDYIYIAAHGNEKGIQVCDKKETFMRYSDFASSICGSPALAEETVLYLGCCEGGFKRGALAMMVNCGNISQICGCECVITANDAAIAFHNYLYLKNKDNSNNKISEHITNILQKRFILYSRVDYDLDIAQIMQFVLYYHDATALLPEDYFSSYRLLQINEEREARNNLQEVENEALVPDLVPA
jgi:hypothetical protein